ncbi:MAG TPA: 1-(5-phosphoribosyl)-5-[(5-phosphoribosylamino)methylideneamino]imidazole-4-carboxamide isomerase [Firmicutes bacterium]|nr:1-(5-phosphoribosyl)-5-[(5-phosphoribosylamino)methylideneamino]imidazole-4-carboxamide isomerase [Bacillota bacterium]
MLVIPAIDLRGGQCVRLYQGDPDRETVFSPDPVEVARQWESLGAKLLHIVDLDGAITGSSLNAAAIAEIGSTVSIPFQLGGGIRSREAFNRALELGAMRVILGTVAVEQPDLTRELAAEHKDRILISIDARNGKVAVKGWTESSDLNALELARRVEKWGIREIVYTDIQRDGTLHGPNFQGIENILRRTSINVLVAGGISSREDIVALKPYRERIKGVIIGQALYTNRLTLPDAINILGS